jgi:N-acetylglucosaminyldiphosphoundecaprenol N-acetyl-beta-D-mannosaminyltransferase
MSPPNADTRAGRSANIGQAPEGAPANLSAKAIGVLGTRLHATTYDKLIGELRVLLRQPHTTVVDFTNTQIVTLRRHEPEFRAITQDFDLFIPDGMPLIWCVNAQGAGLRDRVYGPTFMRHCMLANAGTATHYLLGGTDECLARLRQAFLEKNPAVQIVGCHNGYFRRENEETIRNEIRRLSPDFIWVGLGTPKQQSWIHRNRDQIPRGILLAVGFAFDVNAGTKPDAPLWMQRLGLTWVFRLLSEPRRLAFRYVKYNSLFLFYLVWDGVRKRAWSAGS